MVDDVPPNRKLLNTLLTRDGFHVIEATSGEESLEAFENQHIDIIFMDVMMPGMGGYEATKKIKQIAGNRFIPIILVTALNEHQGMPEGIESGADDYITKPVDAILLKAKVRAMERIRKLHELQFRQHLELKELHDRMESDQRLAENILNTAINQKKDVIVGVTSVVKPAEIFSGDLVLQASLDNGNWYVLVCDFTGHGLSAAVGTVLVTETFYSMASKQLDSKTILAELNYKLRQFLPTNMFMGCVFIEFCSSSKKLMIWNGGMPDILIKEHGSGEVNRRVRSANLPLGIVEMKSSEFHLEQTEMSSGDIMVVYSDGLTETEGPDGEPFGLQRLEQIVQQSDGEALQNSIIDAWQHFKEAGEQADDVTIVTATFK